MAEAKTQVNVKAAEAAEKKKAKVAAAAEKRQVARVLLLQRVTCRGSRKYTGRL